MSDQLSTMPVIKDSTLQNSVSTPKTKSIAKKRIAQIKLPGKLNTSSGYVKKTKPGPDLATSCTDVFCRCAMYPKQEKTRTPAVKQVQVLTMQVMTASLEGKEVN